MIDLPLISFYTTNSTSEKAYQNTVNTFRKGCSREKGVLLHQVTIEEIIGYALTRRGDYAKSTFRFNRSALLWYCRKNYASQYDYYRDVIDQYAANKKTTAKKKEVVKKVDPVLLELLQKEWEVENTVYSRALLNYSYAAINTGLRPSEWINATVNYSGDEMFLQVANAKATHGRSLGKYRNLNITNLEPHIKQSVIQNILFFHQNKAKITNFIAYLSKKLKKDCKYVIKVKKLRCKSFTLYSFRHQFCANAKKKGFSRSEVASFMGHSSDQTAIVHYGKKTNGKASNFGLKVNLDDLERVNPVRERILANKTYQQQMEIYQQKKDKNKDKNLSLSF